MRVLTVYTRPECHLCQEAISRLEVLAAELHFQIRECDIDTDPELQRAYFERIPVGVLDQTELFEYVLDERILRERLRSTAETCDQTESKPEHPLESAR